MNEAERHAPGPWRLTEEAAKSRWPADEMLVIAEVRDLLNGLVLSDGTTAAEALREVLHDLGPPHPDERIHYAVASLRALLGESA